MKACVARRANNGADSSNVASGNSEISECGMRPREKGGRYLGNGVDSSLKPIKVAVHGLYAIQTFLSLKLEGL
ncbi:hypothetical protein PAMP_015766 [Pampus punctatissimus]